MGWGGEEGVRRGSWGLPVELVSFGVAWDGLAPGLWEGCSR